LWGRGKCLGKPVPNKKTPLADTSMSDTLRVSFFPKPLSMWETQQHENNKTWSCLRYPYPQLPPASPPHRHSECPPPQLCGCICRYRTASGSFNSFLLFIFFQCFRSGCFCRSLVNTFIFSTLPSVIAGWPKCLRVLITRRSKL